METEVLIIEFNDFYKNIFEDDLKKNLKKSLMEAMKCTAVSKVNGVKSLTYSLVNASKGLVSFIKNENKNRTINKGYFEKIPERFMVYTYEKIINTAKMINYFNNLRKEEKIKIARDASIFFIVMGMAAGGSDLEGGFPDTDLNLGIGYHRNLFSHTILMPLILEVATRFLVNICSEYRKEVGEMSILGKPILKILDFIEENQELMLGGMWAGISLHLLKDAGLFQNHIKPYTGLNGLSMGEHKAIFTGNSFLSMFFAKEHLKNNRIKSISKPM